MGVDTWSHGCCTFHTKIITLLYQRARQGRFSSLEKRQSSNEFKHSCVLTSLRDLRNLVQRSVPIVTTYNADIRLVTSPSIVPLIMPGAIPMQLDMKSSYQSNIFYSAETGIVSDNLIHFMTMVSTIWNKRVLDFHEYDIFQLPAAS